MAENTPLRWKRTLYIAFFAQLTSAVGFSVIFPFLPLYVQYLGSRWGFSVEFLAGMVFSAQALTMMLASPIWGALADRYGRKLMVERATFGGAIIIFLMAFPRSAEELVLLRAVQGLITGVVAANVALVAAVAPRERAGYALGMLQTALAAGVAIGPLVGGVLADTFGYRITFIVTAVLLLVSGITVWLGVEDRPITPAERARHRSFVEEWRQVLREPGVLRVFGLRFVARLGRAMLAPILPLLVAALATGSAGVATLTGLVTTSRAFSATLSTTWLGRLGDRIGHRRMLRAAALILGIAYLLHGAATSVWHLLVLQALVGVGLGGLNPSIAALLAHYTKEGEEGAVYGLENSVMAAARAVAPMMGAGIAVWGGLRGPFILAGAIYLLIILGLVQTLPDERQGKAGT